MKHRRERRVVMNDMGCEERAKFVDCKKISCRNGLLLRVSSNAFSTLDSSAAVLDTDRTCAYSKREQVRGLWVRTCAHWCYRWSICPCSKIGVALEEGLSALGFNYGELHQQFTQQYHHHHHLGVRVVKWNTLVRAFVVPQVGWRDETCVDRYMDEHRAWIDIWMP